MKNVSFKSKLLTLRKSAVLLPTVIIIHRIKDYRVEYLSPWGIEKLGVAESDIIHLTDSEYHKRYFNEDDAKDYGPKIRDLIIAGDISNVVTFFQQVRTGQNGSWEWYLSASKIFHLNKSLQPEYLITTSSPIDPNHHITNKVNRLLEENNFLREHVTEFSLLSNREKEILALIAKSLSSNEIADQLYISVATVETHRKTIRKKIKAKSQYDVIQFAQAFNLI